MQFPNLFNYATNELSQDAMLAWIAKCADDSYRGHPMHELGGKFIESLYEKAKQTPPPISRVSVKTQENHVDVLVTINDTYTIIIEDKIGTKDHSDQLNRYREQLKQTRDLAHILCIYIQLRHQGDYSNVCKAGFAIYLRKDILQLLMPYAEKEDCNAILKSWYDFLKAIDDDYNSWKNTPIQNKWSFYAWFGFYEQLQAEMKKGNYHYVSNASGGFAGFFWFWSSLFGENEIYLQLEQDRQLCFKIYVEGNNKKEFGELCSRYIIEKGKSMNLPIRRPNRMRSGSYMTVAVWESYRVPKEDGLINMKQTIENLQLCERIIEEILPALQAELKAKFQPN